MHMFRKVFLAGISASLLLVGLSGTVGAHHQMRTYRVTVLNITDGQPFTPPFLVTHRRAVDVFTVGAKASNGVQQIAENGDLSLLKSSLESRRRVGEVVTGDVPIVPFGSVGQTDLGFSNSYTTTIMAPRHMRRITWLSMLICTNDGFTGVDSLRLPRHVGDAKSRFTSAYDAGTERNTERFADMVPPCQALIGVTGDPGTGMSNPALATNGRIHHHRGISGRGDLLPDVHGWTNPVGQIVIQRIS